MSGIEGTNIGGLQSLPIMPKSKSHVYNRKCKVVMVKFGLVMIYCNRLTKRGRLYCEKHIKKPRVVPPLPINAKVQEVGQHFERDSFLPHL